MKLEQVGIEGAKEHNRVRKRVFERVRQMRVSHTRVVEAPQILMHAQPKRQRGEQRFDNVEHCWSLVTRFVLRVDALQKRTAAKHTRRKGQVVQRLD